MAGLDRLAIARTARCATSPPRWSFPRPKPGQPADFTDELEPELNRKSELAAEDVVVAYEQSAAGNASASGI